MAFVSPSRTATWPSSSGGLADVYVNALYLQIDLGRTLSSGKSGDTLALSCFFFDTRDRKCHGGVTRRRYRHHPDSEEFD